MSQAQITPQAMDAKKRALIEATITAISTHGLSNVTLARIAGLAGLTAGSVNFHFTSKEALLLATLRFLADEFEERVTGAVADADEDPAGRLEALVNAHLDPAISEARRIAVWYAFMSESGTRQDYLRICDARDDAYFTAVLGLCREIIDNRGSHPAPDAEAIAYGLVGLIDQVWQEILFTGTNYDRKVARRRCQAYLASVFPWSFTMPGVESTAPAPSPALPLAPQVRDGLKFTLPAWTYRSADFARLELERIFLPSWQIACHVSDLPRSGSYVSFQLLNERAFVVRGADSEIRAFHNVCPHRAHSLVQKPSGTCGGRLTCPYHGWTFNLDGRRIGVSAPDTFATHDRDVFGLKELECEVLFGFVYIRFRPGGPTVRESYAPVLDEFSAYRTQDMVGDPAEDGEGFWTRIVNVDWKNAIENYLEDYHFPTGHRGLSALMEADYDRNVLGGGLARLSHCMRKEPLPNWSVTRYHALLPEQAHLPEQMRKRWTYYALFPNNALDLFPEKMDFMQMLPFGPGKTMLRGKSYVLPDERREMRVLRYLSDRINRRVQHEDDRLTSEVQKGLGTSAYRWGILSDKEVLVKYFQDWVREKMPVAQLAEEPASGTLAAWNLRLGEG